jgi:hypothetical protein
VCGRLGSTAKKCNSLKGEVDAVIARDGCISLGHDREHLDRSLRDVVEDAQIPDAKWPRSESVTTP